MPKKAKYVEPEPVEEEEVIEEEYPKQTIVVITEGEDEAEVSTYNRKWINKLVKLEAEGHATEVEADMEGARQFVLDKSLIHMPYYRAPREYTDEQREEARARLAAVREAVMEEKETRTVKKGTAAKTAATKAAGPAKKKATAPAKKGRKPKIEEVDETVLEEEDEDEEDLEEEYEDEVEEEYDEEDEDEIVVKRPTKKASAPARKTASKKPVKKARR